MAISVQQVATASRSPATVSPGPTRRARRTRCRESPGCTCELRAGSGADTSSVPSTDGRTRSSSCRSRLESARLPAPRSRTTSSTATSCATPTVGRVKHTDHRHGQRSRSLPYLTLTSGLDICPALN